MKEYGFFGALDTELPQMTMARNVLNVSRSAKAEEIKKTYHELMKEWHQDLHTGKQTEDEATERSKIYTFAYNLLTNESERKNAEKEFTKAMQQPFVVGGRVFSIGSIHGVRTYVEEYKEIITEASRLITSGKHSESTYKPQEHYSFYEVRNSIMESQLADLVETFYSDKEVGIFKTMHEDAFTNRERGGLDDLVWIKNNGVAINHFLKREFEKAVKLFEEINVVVQNNFVFMYREGVCLEALAAQLKSRNAKEREWKPYLEKAINIYEKCLNGLRKRKYAILDNRFIMGFEPKSMLTIMMQLADAYAQTGTIGWLKSKELWGKISQIDPFCYEARKKGGSPLQIPLRFVGLLAYHPKR